VYAFAYRAAGYRARSRPAAAVRRGGSDGDGLRAVGKIHEIENTSWYRTRLSPVRNIFTTIYV
jgi:hypothetical protein